MLKNIQDKLLDIDLLQRKCASIASLVEVGWDIDDDEPTFAEVVSEACLLLELDDKFAAKAIGVKKSDVARWKMGFMPMDGTRKYAKILYVLLSRKAQVLKSIVRESEAKLNRAEEKQAVIVEQQRSFVPFNAPRPKGVKTHSIEDLAEKAYQEQDAQYDIFGEDDAFF